MALSLAVLKNRAFLISFFIILVLIGVSVLIRQPFFTLSLSLADVFIILALAWDFSSGTTNYINFGLPFFMAIGAFTTGYFSFALHMAAPVRLAASFGFSFVAGVVFTLPTLRVRGVFFTLLSLLLPLIGTSFILAFWINLKMPTQGYYGISPISLNSQLTLAFLSIAVALILVFLHILRSSKIGLLLRGVGDDEDAVTNQGLNPFPYKVLVFSLSMGLAGLAGSAYAMINRFAGVDTFGLQFLLYPMLIAIFGGKGKLLGAVPAGYIVILIAQYLQLYVGELTLILFSGFAILLFLFVPTGISRWFK